MENKEKYKLFCKQTYVPIFSQPWWMDAVCGPDGWNVFLVEKGNDIWAAMPYYLIERDGLKIITKAPLTQNNGIIFRYPPNQKYISRLDFEENIINQVCDFIESLNIDRYEQQYHYQFVNWLPFYWRKYREITRYTYVIEDTSDISLIEKQFSSNIRKNIKKAKKLVSVKEELDIEKLFEVNEMTYKRQGKKSPFSFEFLKNLHTQCQNHSQGKSYYAIDRFENIHSIIYLVWDSQAVYLILGGSNPEFRSSQAYTLLISESIRFASQMGLKFDFEGSVIQPIENAFRAYGGVQKPYFRIYKTLNPDIEEKIY